MLGDNVNSCWLDDKIILFIKNYSHSKTHTHMRTNNVRQSN